MATEDTFESWLNKATDPANPEARWDCVRAFYQLVNAEAEGPQVATRLLAHKIQSPQAREALQALTVLEACMNNCGRRFHSEATKFRFLNEMIKVLSPKYLGQWSPEEVKVKVTEVLFSWSVWLKDQPKIQEAYRMLKKQGVVKKDPQLPETLALPPPSPRTHTSVFDQEDKATLLARLLKSNRPEDLQTANRLIKSTIKEEQDKAERVSRRVCTLEEVDSCTRQLRGLLDAHTHAGASTAHTHAMKTLYERCDRLRPSLFRLASDTVDDDPALAQILSANDKLTLVLNAYRDLAGTNGRAGGGAKHNGPTGQIKSYHLIDLSALESGVPVSSSPPPPPPPPPARPRLESNLLALDEELTSLGLDQQRPQVSSSYYDDLLQLSGGVQGAREEAWRSGDPLLLGRGGAGGSSASWEGSSTWAVPPSQPISFSGSPSDSTSRPMGASGSLADVCVPVDPIRPSRLEPVAVFDRGGVRVSLHFARDTPPGRPDVAVATVSTVNTSALPAKNFLFQAAVPKTMQVKLLPASGRDLPPYRPRLPPATLRQTLLLANPQRCKVRVRYRVSLLHGDQQLSETGELEELPDWACWLGL